MWLAKIKYKLRSITPKKIFPQTFNFSIERIAAITICILLSSLLVGNIYGSIQDIQSYKILENEYQYLKTLEKENSTLKKDAEYHKSEFFKKLYARESLNLAEDGQHLYQVERVDNVEYKNSKANPDPINLKNSREWWIRLIL